MFRHYILTRFNLMLPGQDIYNNENIKDPAGWLAHRIKLFEKYTLPAMQKQTVKNFTWLLSFSEKTPDHIIGKFDYCDRIKIIYEYPTDYIRRIIPDKKFIITSRLDNDDYYAPDFIETIQNNFNPVNELIDVDYQQLDHFTGKRYTSLRTTPNGPFLSVVEPWGNFVKTCFYCSHSKMPLHYLKASKIFSPLATMVIHDRNVINKIIGDEIK